MNEQVGLIGFGIMGAAIAARLAEQHYSVLVYDVSSAARSRAKELHYTICESPVDVAEQVSVVLMSLAKPEQVRAVVQDRECGLLCSVSQNLIVVDTSTVDPDTSKENAEISEQQGVGYLDCPVLGRPGACGNWTLPVGGNKRYLEIVKPILDTFASRIIPVGPSGYGNLVKLLNNLMFGAINSITCEIFALSQSLNMEPNVLFDTIANSGAGTVSNLFKELGPKIIDREFSPVFSIDNLHKDIALGIALATESGISLNISEIGQELNEKAQAAGLGQEDTAAVVKVYEDLLPLRSEKER